MIYIFLLVCLALTTAKEISNEVDSSSKSKEWKKPWFCHNSDCRPYVVVNKTDRYETRCYPGALWWMTFKRKIPAGEPKGE